MPTRYRCLSRHPDAIPRSRRSGAVSQLIHLNGAPGVGKSSLARRYLEDHPLALLIDIDGIRSALGCWESVEESKVVARTLAVAMAEQHLRDARHVIVPQYLGRRDFIATLEGVARRCDARFVEVVLEAPVAVAADRFRCRRLELLSRGERHPQADVADDVVEAALDDARRRISGLTAGRDDAILISADQPIEDSYAELVAALGGYAR